MKFGRHKSYDGNEVPVLPVDEADVSDFDSSRCRARMRTSSPFTCQQNKANGLKVSSYHRGVEP